MLDGFEFFIAGKRDPLSAEIRFAASKIPGGAGDSRPQECNRKATIVERAFAASSRV
jgi:hypothetical protein